MSPDRPARHYAPLMSTLFVGGSIFRSGVGSVPGWGVRVAGRRIDAVLPDAALLSARESGDEVIDVQGGLISPGFVDSHYHPTVGGLDLNACSLTGAGGAEECLRIIGAYAAAHPELEWIIGAGWEGPFFPGGNPTAALLDTVVPDRPAIFPNADHHGAWVNTRALERAGITAATPDPQGGRLERDADGNPTGMLHEAAADLVHDLCPPITDQAVYDALVTGQAHAFSLGVTGWQDAIVGSSSAGKDNFHAYLKAKEEGVLKARVRLALWWDRARDLDQIEFHNDRRAQASALGLDASSIKIMVDGVAENFTAAVSAPYLDHCGHATNNTGHTFIPADVMREVVSTAHAHNFQCHFHALGDRAVTEALDSLEHAAALHGAKDLRHHLAHLQMIRLVDIPRFAALGAAANLQPLWAQAETQMTELTLPFLDPNLRDRQYPFGDLLRAGTTLVAGSDWPVSSANPLWGMQVATTRQYIQDPAPPLLPEQALPLERVWTAYTAGAAWVNHSEFEYGSLTPGHFADLAVLDGNPFDGDPNQISHHSVVRTVVGGDTVYEA